jgi:hypothetical protein
MKYRVLLLSALTGLILSSDLRQLLSTGRNQQTKAGCTLLIKGEPPQTITFERSEKKPNGEEVVWLRLHNNTSCDVIIPTASIKLAKTPNGQFTTELQDGALVEVYYELEEVLQTKAITPGPYGLGDEIIVSKLHGGKSIIFSIPKNYIRQEQHIRVPFKYDWEGGPAPSAGVVKHYVYLSSQDILTK